MDMLERFLNVVSKPFSTSKFTSLTGIPENEAEVILNSAEQNGRLCFVNRIWIIRPERVQVKERQYDFKPDEKKLKGILSTMIPGVAYKSVELANSNRMAKRTMQRYVHTLLYLGCVGIEKECDKKYRRYVLISDQFETSKIPYYFAMAKGQSNECRND